MHLQSITVRNFRRLKNARIDLDQKTSIFVGSNNSGKTSATYILHKFLDHSGNKPSFTIHDFSSDCWKKINEQMGIAGDQAPVFPSISLDIWLSVEASDLHRIIDLLPNLDWDGVPVGVRIEFGPKDAQALLAGFKEAHAKATEKKKDNYHPWPKSLTDYLTKMLKSEYETRYYVLDRGQFDEDYKQLDGYVPLQLGNDTDRPGAKIIRSLIRIDMLYAQRYLDDQQSTGRSEDLSKRMNRFYDRNLEKKDEDFEAMHALANSEDQLTKHLSTVFNSTLESLNKLYYPGFSNPQLVVKATLNHDSIAGQTKLHYSLGGDGELLSLPDRYNGLGFKNLIYMVIEILDFHARWKEYEDNRAPLHLIIIEEPEAHLHAQLQQVFIKKIWEVIHPVAEAGSAFSSQMIVTTHSPHIIYESGFQPIRYFRRCTDETNNLTTEVLNLTTFYRNSKSDTRAFLQRYMKLTHCDLFFADASILVEGNVERLLLPLMINKSTPELNSSYLTTLEIGGAFGHLFRELIEFLGLTTLIITDLDSVEPKAAVAADKNEVADAAVEVHKEDKAAVDQAEEILDEEDEDLLSKPGKSCIAEHEGAVTSNQTLIKWLPKLTKVSDLLAASQESKIQKKSADCKAHVHIVYQTQKEVSWMGETAVYAGRTIEESFALENLDWTQKIENKDLKLRVITLKDNRTLEDIHKRLYKRINEGDFNKTDFALGLMMKDPADWSVPDYIEEGLNWLKKEIAFVNKQIGVEEKAEAAVALEVGVGEAVLDIKTEGTDEQESK